MQTDPKYYEELEREVRSVITDIDAQLAGDQPRQQWRWRASKLLEAHRALAEKLKTRRGEARRKKNAEENTNFFHAFFIHTCRTGDPMPVLNDMPHVPVKMREIAEKIVAEQVSAKD